MVQNENSNNSGDESTAIIKERKPKGIPIGKYRLVGWGVDTTGKRLIDEICQIAAYTPKSQFSQYIMPFADLNPSFRRKHSIRVINTGKYRMLKDMRSNKFVKTKSDVSALTDFIIWLEKLYENETNDGIILMYHEIRKTAPGMLLEVLKRYNLLERFSKIVKGFANGFNISQMKCAKTTKSFSLKVMSKVLLGSEEDYSSAVDRARAAYNIAIHLAQGERQNLNNTNDDNNNSNDESEFDFIEFICPFTNPICAEEEEIAEFKILLERQNTFRPVFGALLRANRTERQHASHLRRLLAENNINYEKLKEAYENGAKEGLDKVLKAEVANAKEADLSELLDILDCFFDPDKKAVQPKPRYYHNPNNNHNNRRPRIGGNGGGGGAGGRKPFNHSNNNTNNSSSKDSDTNNSPNVSSDNNQIEQQNQQLNDNESVVVVVDDNDKQKAVVEVQ